MEEGPGEVGGLAGVSGTGGPGLGPGLGFEVAGVGRMDGWAWLGTSILAEVGEEVAD